MERLEIENIQSGGRLISTNRPRLILPPLLCPSFFTPKHRYVPSAIHSTDDDKSETEKVNSLFQSYFDIYVQSLGSSE